MPNPANCPPTGIEALRKQVAALNAPLCTRYAPSANGYLHLGHVVNSLYTWGIARLLGAQVVVRLEDNDKQRCRPEYAQAILEDLCWLGFLSPQQLPQVRWQQQQYAHYAQLLATLVTQGHAYACTCSRAQILERSPQPHAAELRYDNHCRGLKHPLAENAVRAQLPSGIVCWTDALLGEQVQTPQAQCGDLVLRDRNGNYTYHFCVVADDLAQGVNLIIRGQDLLSATARQLQLAQLIQGTPWQPVYYHHPLVTDTAGRKLSKTDGATGIRELREQGLLPQQVLGLAAATVGLLPTGSILHAEQVETLFPGV